jgi:hypothetical protein
MKKNYIVTLLLSLLVALVTVMARRDAVKKAPVTQTRTVNSLVAVGPSPTILPQIAIGPGPIPCPPNCGLHAK